MKYKMVGFDLDGTLVNTLNAIAKGVNIALKLNNLKTYDNQYFKNLVGGGLDKLTKKIILMENYDEKIFEKLSKDIKNECLKNFSYDLKLYEGIDYLLKYLEKNNILIVVITNKAHNIAVETRNLILKEYKFCEFFGASDKYKLKPDKEILDMILEKYNIKKSEFLYIGDMNVDIEFSKNSNVDVIYCNWGFGNLKGEEISKNIKRVDNVEQIINYLN